MKRKREEVEEEFGEFTGNKRRKMFDLDNYNGEIADEYLIIVARDYCDFLPKLLMNSSFLYDVSGDGAYEALSIALNDSRLDNVLTEMLNNISFRSKITVFAYSLLIQAIEKRVSIIVLSQILKAFAYTRDELQEAYKQATSKIIQTILLGEIVDSKDFGTECNTNRMEDE
ncbi:MAG: hypothetical protein ABH827_05200 [bacterium]